MNKYLICVWVTSDQAFLWDYANQAVYDYTMLGSNIRNLAFGNVIRVNDVNCYYNKQAGTIVFSEFACEIVGTTNISDLIKKLEIIGYRPTSNFENLLKLKDQKYRKVVIAEFSNCKIINEQLKITHGSDYSYVDIQDEDLKKYENKVFRGKALLEFIPTRKNHNAFKLITTFGQYEINSNNRGKEKFGSDDLDDSNFFLEESEYGEDNEQSDYLSDDYDEWYSQYEADDHSFTDRNGFLGSAYVHESDDASAVWKRSCVEEEKLTQIVNSIRVEFDQYIRNLKTELFVYTNNSVEDELFPLCFDKISYDDAYSDGSSKEDVLNILNQCHERIVDGYKNYYIYRLKQMVPKFSFEGNRITWSKSICSSIHFFCEGPIISELIDAVNNRKYKKAMASKVLIRSIDIFDDTVFDEYMWSGLYEPVPIQIDFFDL